ncbi:S-layer homology domain-containing protein [Aeromicrobium ponti]|uniref:Beta-lactamase superfamily II metal-dependent hydrolase n=1 Tax=Cytobacillus oceanisediminis TaxID=665099 RepID=A0A562JWE0_9BACI|nr:S-layer homology domain-containing protein [Cytobacillus oceanisediminis]TWH87491.1 beta-lactamase superfamily II metal-dependent hydrolase [Cytobacillus oceanisediminis]
MKKLFSLFFVFVLVFSGFSQSTYAQGFKDLTSDHRFFEEINYLVDGDIITGFPDGTFRPNVTVTRAQAAIMIGRALDLDGTQRDTKFKDVNSDVKASGYIDSAVQKGIILGFPDNTFRPDAPVTRGQMAIFLARAFDLTEELQVSFSDVSSGMSAYVYIKRILADGITAGYPDNTFRTDSKLSRGDFSAFLARALDVKFKVTVPGQEMEVHFIDVGQGDSIYIKTPNGKNILVDGGKQLSNLKVPTYLMEAGVSSIDLLVATHPDADHIGGLVQVLKTLPVKQVLDSGATHTSQTFLEYLSIIDEKNIPFKVAKEGEFIDIDSALKIQVLNTYEDGEDNNEGSVVLKVSYNEIDFLLTGDADYSAEHEMINKYNVEAEVLKVSHHGSNTTSSLSFLEEVSPEVSVLSYGEENQYGHPHSEVIDRLLSVGSEVYSTVTSGNIVVDTNGITYEVHGTPDSLPGDPQEPSGKASILNVDLDKEIVTIKNNDSIDIDMTGWKLVSVEGNQTYDFPEGYVLKSGATVYVTSGNNAQDQPPTYLKWTGAYIWNNDGDAAELYNAEGVKVSEVK